MVTTLLWLLVGGLAAGLLTGLLGLGGGMVLVPLLYQYYLSLATADHAAFTTAVASTLAVMMFSGGYAFWLHWRAGRIEWRLILWLGFGAVGGTMVGSYLLNMLAGSTIRQAFGIFLFLIAFIHYAPRPVLPEAYLTNATQRSLMYRYGLMVLGVLMGVASFIFGTGGAVIAIPVLAWIFKVPLIRAISTASAMILISASLALFHYSFLTEPIPDMPRHGYGWIDFVAVGYLLPGMLLMIPMGIKIAHRIPAIWLKHSLAGFNVLMGLRFILY